MQAGYSLPEAIRCATHNGAQLPRIENAFRLIAKAGELGFPIGELIMVDHDSPPAAGQ